MTIKNPKYTIDLLDGELKGEEVIQIQKYLKDIADIFEEGKTITENGKTKLAYAVQAILPVQEGTEGGLFYGRTVIEPGLVGNEYYMTKGHFHEKIDRAEFYWGINGEGMLLLMDEERNAWAEKIFPGSLHYVKGRIAHRTINTGKEQLVIGACWPSDAGHNYEKIMKNGFSIRVKKIGEKPKLVFVK